MVTKAKPKSKPAKKVAARTAAGSKSIRLKAKQTKGASTNGTRNGAKSHSKGSIAHRTGKVPAVESRRTTVATGAAPSRTTTPERARSKHFGNAIQAYEAGLKAMHAEDFEKAIRCFKGLIAEYPEEPEIQERASVLLHACEKKIQERGRTVLRSADDHYNVGIAELNRRELDSAITHLQHALKLTPKADHILS